MRHPIRSAIVAGTSALLLTAGAGTASAQGSLQFALPFPVDIPGLASLADGGGPAADAPASPDAGAPDAESPNTPDAATLGAPAAAAQGEPAFAMPAVLAQKAFEGRVVAGINEARTAVGAERLVTDPVLAAGATERAEKLAVGDPTTGDLTVPEDAATHDRTVLTQPADATPQSVLTALLSDEGMRERMLNGEFAKIGVGTATDEDGRIHTVLDFEQD